MLGVFNAFSAATPELTAEQIMARLGYSRGTAYRYVRELVAVGLLARAGGGAYTLGPRIIELDYAIRLCDPVLRAAVPEMQALCRKFECDVLLTILSDDHVIVTHHEVGSDRIQMSYGRGRAMPMFRGAPAKVILAALPLARQKRIYQEHAADIAGAGLGTDWDEFRAVVQGIRKAGHFTSFAELDPNNVGVAVPLTGASPQPGSLALVLSQPRYDIVDKNLLLADLGAAAQRITLSTTTNQNPGDPHVLHPS